MADELAREKAVKIGRNHETNSNSLKKPSKDEDPTVNNIETKKRPKQMRPRNKGQEKKRETNKSKDKCGRCGYDKTHKKCPAMGQQCGLCKKMNHYAKFCRSKEVHNLEEVVDSDPEEEESEEESPLFVYSLESSSVREDEQFYMNPSK